MDWRTSSLPLSFWICCSRRSFFAVEQAQDQAGCFGADVVLWLVKGGQRGIGVGRKDDVVEADNRDVFRYTVRPSLKAISTPIASISLKQSRAVGRFGQFEKVVQSSKTVFGGAAGNFMNVFIRNGQSCGIHLLTEAVQAVQSGSAGKRVAEISDALMAEFNQVASDLAAAIHVIMIDGIAVLFGGLVLTTTIGMP